MGIAGIGLTAPEKFAFSTSFANEQAERKFWYETLYKIAYPVLKNLSEGKLKENMPIYAQAGSEENRREVIYLEAFGRTLAGVAPWLTASSVASEEKKQQAELHRLALASIDKAVDPSSPDFMNFNKGSQPLVDAAFFAHALLRAPDELWKPLSNTVKEHVINAFKSTRVIVPYYNNWILFSAMIEAFLLYAGEDWDAMRVDLSLKKIDEWYLGDGHFGDGPEFHWDYYNSYVIQPFMLDILQVVKNKTDAYASLHNKMQKIAQRYALIQERLISPEGTFPVIGRSIPYRFGAFQLLAQLALMKILPEELPPAQVRSALTAVISKVMEAKSNFDEEGWLNIGLYGKQPGLGEGYISTGSLYLCTTVFLPLGLSQDDPYWSGPTMDWTSKKIWSGENLEADKAWKV
ncbi:MAG: DUF2264 domain-containing protein [Cyclobacteriaceae bacterium]